MAVVLLGGNRLAQQGMQFHIPQQGPQYHAPPIQMLHVPLMPPFAGGGFALGAGHGGRSTGRHNNGQGYGHGGRVHTPIANHAGHSSIIPFGGGGGFQLSFVEIGGIGQALTPSHINPPHSNVTKKFNNWNAYYSCGFDVEDGHTSITGPSHWRKPTHTEGYTHANAQEYLNRDPNM
jgi:hypothetical protein